MVESAASLKVCKTCLTIIRKKKRFNGEFDKAIKYLFLHTDFNSFNRAEFITAYCNPVTTNITALEKELNIQTIKYNRLLNQDAKTLFDTNAFNVNAYTPDQSSFATDEKITLGKRLFSDPVLSGNGIRSCQSCHQPDKAFTDGLVKNTMISSNKVLDKKYAYFNKCSIAGCTVL